MPHHPARPIARQCSINVRMDRYGRVIPVVRERAVDDAGAFQVFADLVAESIRPQHSGVGHLVNVLRSHRQVGTGIGGITADMRGPTLNASRYMASTAARVAWPRSAALAPRGRPAGPGRG